MYSAAARQANFLKIFLFADPKFEHLRLPRFNHFHRGFHNRWLDTPTADRTRQLTALAHRQLRTRSAWCRTIHRHYSGNRHTLAAFAPALDIRQYIKHQIPPLIAKSIDLFGNPVYSVSCGVVWSWLAHPPFLDPL